MTTEMKTKTKTKTRTKTPVSIPETTPMNETMNETTTTALKRLGFVADATQSGGKYVSEHALAKKVVDTAPAALAEADARVDHAVKALGETYDARVKNSAPMRTANAAYAYAMKAKERYPENVQALKTARAEYLAKIESTLEDLKTRAVKLPE